jgi:hypothetical protein
MSNVRFFGKQQDGSKVFSRLLKDFCQQMFNLFVQQKNQQFEKLKKEMDEWMDVKWVHRLLKAIKNYWCDLHRDKSQLI